MHASKRDAILMNHLRIDLSRWITTVILAVVGLTGCVTPDTQQPLPVSTAVQTQAPAEFPAAYYQQATALGKKILTISPTNSLVTIEVRRGGRLARLGHDHVVASHDVNGFVDLEEGRADLYLPLANLTVDEATLRADAGLDTKPTAEAIEGTRSNMLNKVLEADRFPFALIRATRIDPAQSVLHVSIQLHGVTREFDVPVQMETNSDGITVNGRVSFNQTDFGIVPFSVLGGAMQVQDRVDLRFNIVANRRH
jgi:polyisoprenoid-binding protein YceI